MIRIALQILLHQNAKFFGLLAGISFSAFLMAMALAYLSGFLTRGYALIDENPTASIWVMDSAVTSTEQTSNLSYGHLKQVQSIDGVQTATPLGITHVTARYANGAFQELELIGVDDSALTGAPRLNQKQKPSELIIPNSLIIDDGGTTGKTQTPINQADEWPIDGPHLNAQTRPLRKGDTIKINDQQVRIVGRSKTIPRFPARPLGYCTFSTLLKLDPGKAKHLTYILVNPIEGLDPAKLAQKITAKTGLKALTRAEFIQSTVEWYLKNSEDVGDMTNAIIMALIVGVGASGILLYIFTLENMRNYATLEALGATFKKVQNMIWIQMSVTVLLGFMIGIGTSVLTGIILYSTGSDLAFRLLWFTPVLVLIALLAIGFIAVILSLWPLKNMDVTQVFSANR